MGTTGTLRFRHNQAIWVAAVLAFLAALPLATSRWFLLPLLLVPVAVGVWAWRAGTDADPAGVRIRALLGQRRIAWSEIVELASDPRGQAVVRLRDGRTTALPAVRATDLPDLVAASGQPLAGAGETRERPDPAGQ
ncbi:PH domain-containing protein [Plantactinospora sp. WMMC1484]|uniref:PH domain-containing protein n=1 Tax=Plantactinospora sp. WMMC1484 TaxID=3404122 RepID=UPI003BF56272